MLLADPHAVLGAVRNAYGRALVAETAAVESNQEKEEELVPAVLLGQTW